MSALADRFMASGLPVEPSNLIADAINNPVSSGVYYDARAYGGTWDATHDVGAAINAAIEAANTAGGGTVLIPAGEYGVSTPILQSHAKVRLVGGGIGIPRDQNPTKYLAGTRLIWIGAADATMCLISGGYGVNIYACDVWDIVFDAASLAAVGIRFTNVSYSMIKVGGAEAKLVNIWWDTDGIIGTQGPGNQQNDAWLYSRSTHATNAPTGILLDCGPLPPARFNTSFNRFHELFAWYRKGDGIVFAGNDNNITTDIITYADPSAATGIPLVFANNMYVMPNGNPVGYGSFGVRVLHYSSPAVMQGFQTNSTITAGVGNTGTAALATFTIATNATTATGSDTLNFASTTGVVIGMAITSPGSSSGVMNHAIVRSLTATTVRMRQAVSGAVASGVSFIFGYGITISAVAGTYTITCVDATHWDITAPAGGHSQSNIALASGAVTFTDLVLPLTGTPIAGDTFTLVVPVPSKRTRLEFLDTGNGQPVPLVEPGADGWVSTDASPWPVAYGGTGLISSNPSVGLVSLDQVLLGNLGGSVGTTGSEAAVGGIANSVTGLGAGAFSGHQNVVSGIFAFGIGETNNVDGTHAFGSGEEGSTRQRFNTQVVGAGMFSVSGDCQIALQPLSGSGTSATIVRLTADKAAANTVNTMNLANRSTYRIALEVTAHQTGGASGTRDDSAMWTAVVLVKRGAAAANTVFVGGYYVAITTLANTAIVAGTGFTPTIADVAAAAWLLTINVDTTNGGLAVSGTGEANKNIEWLCRAVSVEVVN